MVWGALRPELDLDTADHAIANPIGVAWVENFEETVDPTLAVLLAGFGPGGGRVAGAPVSAIPG
jgi:hypothetical protein